MCHRPSIAIIFHGHEEFGTRFAHIYNQPIIRIHTVNAIFPRTGKEADVRVKIISVMIRISASTPANSITINVPRHLESPSLIYALPTARELMKKSATRSIITSILEIILPIITHP